MEKAKNKTISIYPSAQKLLTELGKKLKLSDSRIIDLAITQYHEKEINKRKGVL